MNTKAASERYQRQVQDISKQPGNNTCADCNGRYPRWASWNLGIFLCMNCAGVHRKMGTHITKVKSLTLDTWTKEQVEGMRTNGNVKSNMKYNPDEKRNRPPANVEEGENSELERFIFDKYRGKFMDASNPPPVPIKDKWHVSPNPTGSTSSGDSSRRQFPSNSLGTPSSLNKSTGRSSTSPFPSTWADAQRATSVSPAPAIQATSSSASTTTLQAPPLPNRSGSSASIARDTVASGNGLAPPVASVPPRSSSASISTQTGTIGLMHNAATNGIANGYQGIRTTANATSTSSVFDDLLSLQEPAQPLVQPAFQMVQPGQQLNPWAYLATQQQAVVSPMVMANTVNGIETSSSPFFQQQQQRAPQSPFGPAGFAGAGDQQRSVSLGTMAFTPTGLHLQQQQQQFNPQMMGQQAFGGQYAAAQQQQIFFAGQQQQPSPNTNNPFGSFANTMMPTGMQQQSAQQPMWNQQQQHYQPFNQWQ